MKEGAKHIHGASIKENILELATSVRHVVQGEYRNQANVQDIAKFLVHASHAKVGRRSRDLWTHKGLAGKECVYGIRSVDTHSDK